MARGLKAQLKADPTNWLLEPNNPAVRYLTLRDIIDSPDEDSESLRAKEAIKSYEKIERIFRKQKPEGHWESADRPYLPKYKSSYWQIMILGQLGLDRSDARVARACEHIFSFQLEEGGFSIIGLKGTAKE